MRKALTNQPRTCRSDAIIARILSELSEFSFSPSHSFCRCTGFWRGTAHRTRSREESCTAVMQNCCSRVSTSFGWRQPDSRWNFGAPQPARGSSGLTLGGQLHSGLQNRLRPFGHFLEVVLTYASATPPMQQKLWFRPPLRPLITFRRIVE